jgi:hypothetical protein
MKITKSRKGILILAFISSLIILFCLIYPEYKRGDYAWSCNRDGSCDGPKGFCVIEVNTKETICTRNREEE